MIKSYHQTTLTGMQYQLIINLLTGATKPHEIEDLAFARLVIQLENLRDTAER